VKTTLALLRLRLAQARAGRLPWLAAVHLGLVAVVLALASAPTPEGRLRVALALSLALAALIATVGSVAFAASIIPDERESRRIHRVLSAPVSRPALALATFASSAILGLALAFGLTVLSLPLIALAGDSDSRDSVFRSTLHLRADSFESHGVVREVDGLRFLHRQNPLAQWSVVFDPDDLAEGDVRGEITLARMPAPGGDLKEIVPVEVTVLGQAPRIVRIGTDHAVPVTVPADVARSGPVRVQLRHLDPALILGVNRESLRFDGRHRFFAPEFALAALGSGLIAALLAVIAVAVSTVASAGVSTAAALAIGVMGTLRGFLGAAAEGLLTGTDIGHGPPVEPSALERLAAMIVQGLVAVAPDLDAMSLATPLRAGRIVAVADLAGGVDDLLIGVGVAVVAGVLLLRGREYP